MTFEVGAKECVVLWGPNGSGKTTLFDCISGKIDVDCGRIWLGDKDITQESEKKRSAYFGRLFQNTYLGVSRALSVRENLRLASLKGRLPCVSSKPSEEIEKRLEWLGMSQYQDTPVGALSGGERQLIAFMMTTLFRPKVILLDEPTAALDVNAKEKLMQFIRAYIEEEGVAALMITHDPVLQHFGSRIIRLR
jgi:putative ABC transport system ATP-binding protein